MGYFTKLFRTEIIIYKQLIRITIRIIKLITVPTLKNSMMKIALLATILVAVSYGMRAVHEEKKVDSRESLSPDFLSINVNPAVPTVVAQPANSSESDSVPGTIAESDRFWDFTQPAIAGGETGAGARDVRQPERCSPKHLIGGIAVVALIGVVLYLVINSLHH